jgi:uncharacterized protein (DUF488 family)
MFGQNKRFKIFTIGHGALALEEFLRRLQTPGIKALADVRRFPTSKRHPQFARAGLAAALNRQGIAYYWLGETLGGYETYMQTEAFRQGCRELIQLAQAQPLAFMCAELDYRGCHRRFISDSLHQSGFEIWHIGKSGELLPHAESESRITMQLPFASSPVNPFAS